MIVRKPSNRILKMIRVSQMSIGQNFFLCQPFWSEWQSQFFIIANLKKSTEIEGEMFSAFRMESASILGYQEHRIKCLHLFMWKGSTPVSV